MWDIVIDNFISKLEVAQFKRNDMPKVVGYFDTKKSLAYDEFVDSALDFQPLVPFYAIFSRQLAKSLGLKDVGQIDFYEVTS